MIAMLDDTVGGLPAIDLASLDLAARLHTRRDRKYIVAPDVLDDVLVGLPAGAAALEIGCRRSFRYESTYFDTPDFVSYRMAATARPKRFKVRIRRYVDDDVTVLEVKTRNRRGDTVKRRRSLAPGADRTWLDDESRSWIGEIEEASPHVARLRPVITTHYTRSTLVFPEIGARSTIDTDLICVDASGRAAALGDLVIVETKSAGGPSPFDRVLWNGGVRPARISKFAFGVASLHPELASNRWTGALRRASGERGGGRSIPDEL